MLYCIEKNDYGMEYALATLPEIHKLVFDGRETYSLSRVARELKKAERNAIYVGEKGEEYYFIWYVNGRWVIDI